MIGAAGGLGGVLVGLTGGFNYSFNLKSVIVGLAAPIVASGVAALTASTALAGLSTTAGAVIFGTAFGAAGIF
jgi:hypothetical protein